MSNSKTPTPMMKQFLEIKSNYQDSVLFFRMGDFYEMFNQDAIEVSRLLNITLTQRGGHPMCGVPHHASANYIKRLLAAGRKIAVCEQTSEPGLGKGIVSREVTRVITPGTVIEEAFLEQNSNNYIAAAAIYSDFFSFSWVDISTGEFKTSAYPLSRFKETLKREVFRINCTEIIIQESLLRDYPDLYQFLNSIDKLIINRYPDWSFDLDSSIKQLTLQYKTVSLKGFGIPDGYPGLYTCGVLLEYLKDNSRAALRHLASLSLYSEENYLQMDEATLKNLEIIKNLHDGSSSFTLFKILNYTKSSGGSRLLKQWLMNPLLSVDLIKQRQKRVEFLFHQQMLLSSLRDKLSQIMDQQRLATRISMDKAHAKDMLALGRSLVAFLSVKSLVDEYDKNYLFFSNLPEFYKIIYDISQLIVNCIVDEPSILLSEGNMIREGYHEELDHYRGLRTNSKELVNQYLETEKKQTGISNLRIKYNKIIGYFLEVSKSHGATVPDYFIRRQSLVSSERFTTDQLIKLEGELNNATDLAVELEKKLFLELRDSIKPHLDLIYQSAEMVATLDCFQSFAQAATVNNYHCPQINKSNRLTITNGRHPVVEKSLIEGNFVPNSVDLNSESNSFMMITGPNMAGKSTLLRQAALITLMAQTGSFVPSQNSKIGVVDKIFCRVGASDNLARGESTFLVEMNETANILRNATVSSLVIMDEVGRGTSTNDGLSIAWAVCEFLLERRCRTLFATHYHELTLIDHPSMVNMSLKVAQEKEEITFLKELVSGPAGNSYGIYAAKLAGVPNVVLERATQIMNHLLLQEKKDLTQLPSGKSQEVDLFSPSEQMLQQILSYDLYQKTPLEVMQDLASWQKKIKEISF